MPGGQVAGATYCAIGRYVTSMSINIMISFSKIFLHYTNQFHINFFVSVVLWDVSINVLNMNHIGIDINLLIS